MTDAQIIETIGTLALGRALDIKGSQVAHWKRRGIPFRRRIDVLNLAHQSIPDAEAFLRGEGRR